MAPPVRYSHSGGPFQRFNFRKMVAGAHLVVWSGCPCAQQPLLAFPQFGIRWVFSSWGRCGSLSLSCSLRGQCSRQVCCLRPGYLPNSRAPGSHLDTAGSAARTRAPACPESGSMKTVSAHSSGPRPALSILEMHLSPRGPNPRGGHVPSRPRLQNASRDTREGAARAFHGSSQCRREAGGSPASYSAHPTPHSPPFAHLPPPPARGPGKAPSWLSGVCGIPDRVRAPI